MPKAECGKKQGQAIGRAKLIDTYIFIRPALGKWLRRYMQSQPAEQVMKQIALRKSPTRAAGPVARPDLLLGLEAYAINK